MGDMRLTEVKDISHIDSQKSHNHRNQDKHPFCAQLQVGFMAYPYNRLKEPLKPVEVFANHNWKTNISGNDGEKSQYDKRNSHHRWRFMEMLFGFRFYALFAMKGEED